MAMRLKTGKLFVMMLLAGAALAAHPGTAIAAECSTDADCGPCAICVAGACEGLGVIGCAVDGDCATDEYCVVVADAPCRNHCASKTCWVVDCLGTCDPYTAPCAAGQACVEPIKGCCGTCQAAPECITSADCGSCMGCVAGECKGLGGVLCTANQGCAADEFCSVVEGAECLNHCVSNTCMVVKCLSLCDPYTSPCDAGQTCVQAIKGCCGTCQPDPTTCQQDSDCGACAACVSGECKGLGAVMCTVDSDCGAGSACAVDPFAACNNHCVALPDGVLPDAPPDGDVPVVAELPITTDVTPAGDVPVAAELPPTGDLPQAGDVPAEGAAPGQDVATTADATAPGDDPAPPSSGSGAACAASAAGTSAAAFLLLLVAAALAMVRRPVPARKPRARADD